MCPQLEEPVDGFLRITGLVAGADTFYFCDDGFEVSGLLRRRCLPTGQWSGEAAVCNRESYCTCIPLDHLGIVLCNVLSLYCPIAQLNEPE